LDSGRLHESAPEKAGKVFAVFQEEMMRNDYCDRLDHDGRLTENLHPGVPLTPGAGVVLGGTSDDNGGLATIFQGLETSFCTSPWCQRCSQVVLS
jgi:hypothetical protein